MRGLRSRKPIGFRQWVVLKRNRKKESEAGQVQAEKESDQSEVDEEKPSGSKTDNKKK
ncbi:MAG: hypothetical protein ACLUD0_08890 [Eubacterium ramulus]